MTRVCDGDLWNVKTDCTTDAVTTCNQCGRYLCEDHAIGNKPWKTDPNQYATCHDCKVIMECITAWWETGHKDDPPYDFIDREEYLKRRALAKQGKLDECLGSKQ